LAFLLIVMLAVPAVAQTVVEHAVSEPRRDPVRDPDRPAVFIVGDSTVKNHGPGEGWGDYLAPFLDEGIQVLNWALEGRSTRSFLEEGRWGKVLAQVRPGDFVLLQFGHNDQKETEGGRGTLASAGDESQQVVSAATGRAMVVRTYGWYLRQYARAARDARAALLFLSPVPRNHWKDDGSFDNTTAIHARLMAEVAARERAAFFDLNAAVARLYVQLGRQAVTERFFTAGDNTHPNAAGAEANAMTVVDGIRGVPALGLSRYVKATALRTITGPRPPAWARGIEGQRRADLGNGYYLNPVMSGDRPDPSFL
jgi:lysophospholipase L1-like esterase